VQAHIQQAGVVTLSRSIRLPHATALVIGIIVGASIFVQPSEVSRLVPGVGGMLAVWIAAGALTLVGALICAELSSAFPETGGVYVFLRELFSPAAAFLWGWAMFWSMHSGIIAAIATVFGRYLAALLGTGDAAVRPLAIAAILLPSLVNYFGVRPGSRLQAAVTWIKLAAIAGLVALLFGWASTQEAAISNPPSSTTIGNFLLAVGAGLFAFGGWHMVTYSAGETEDARRTIPRALLLGTLTVTAAYMALNAAYLAVLPAERVLSSSRVAADAAAAAAGPRAAALVAALVVVSAFGAVNGIILAGPRVYLAMARDGLAPRWIGDVHERFRTPHHAIVAQAIWASLLVLTGTYRGLFTRVVYTEWIFFGALAIGLLIARRRPHYEPAFRLPAVPVLPALFAAGCALIVVEHVAAAPIESLIGLSMVAAGLPVYAITREGWTRKARQEARAAQAPTGSLER
jgi:APA family basic amino acid/polyamine antiporter